ncbi:MAG: hypothetical protein P4L00_08960 [Candidatus Acidoferrales bacterium]|nr:hypothetical protein [Candidatus Acidoferrales bacterium]
MKAPQPKSAGSPKRQLDSFLARFTPEIAMLARRALAKMRRRLPNAIELVYDNYNALVIGFGPNERPSDAIFSIAIFPRKVGLCFLQGAKLPDPDKRLKGSGNVVRSVTLNDLSILDDPQIRALIDVALLRAKVRMDPKQKRKLIIRSISAKQRPRRPA